MQGPTNIDAIERHATDTSANTALITVPATVGQYWVVDGVYYSYDTIPTSDTFQLLISYGTTVDDIIVFWIQTAGTQTGCVRFPRGIASLDANGAPIYNQKLWVQCRADPSGEPGIVCKVNLLYR